MDKIVFCCFDCASNRSSTGGGVEGGKRGDACAWKKGYSLLEDGHAELVTRFETFIKEQLGSSDLSEQRLEIQGWELLDKYVQSRLTDEVLASLEDPGLRLFWAGGLKEALTEDGQRDGPPLAGIALMVALSSYPNFVQQTSENFLNFPGMLQRIEQYMGLFPMMARIHDHGVFSVPVQEKLQDSIVSFAKEVLLCQIKFALCYQDRLVSDDPATHRKWPNGNDASRREIDLRIDTQHCLDAIGEGSFPVPDDDECLRALGHDLTDGEELFSTQTDERDIVPACCEWVFGSEEYKRWDSGGEAEKNILWITGGAGKGKTTLMRAIVRQLQRNHTKPVSAYYVCSASASEASSHGAEALRGLVKTLVKSKPQLIHHLKETLKYDRTVFATHSACYVAGNTLRAMLADEETRGAIICIDALDESGDVMGHLMELLASQGRQQNIKWVVTSRTGTDAIDQRLGALSNSQHLCLDDHKEELVDAVRIYAHDRINRLAKRRDTPATKYEIRAIEGKIATRADDTILHAALAIEQLEGLTTQEDVNRKLDPISIGIDSVYGAMLDSVRRSADQQVLAILLSVCAAVKRPLLLDELMLMMNAAGDLMAEESHEWYSMVGGAAIPIKSGEELAVEDSSELVRLVTQCRHFIEISHPLRRVAFVHASAKEYLLGRSNETGVPHGKIHLRLLMRSLAIMSQRLSRDMWKLGHAGASSQGRRPVADTDPLTGLGYACVYWTAHLEYGYVDADELETVENAVIQFILEQFHEWMEALSLLGALSKAEVALERLQKWAKTHNRGELGTLVGHCQRFYLAFREAIHQAPLQVYTSGILFTPTDSPLRRDSETSVANLSKDWPNYEQVLSAKHKNGARLSYSADGHQLIISCEDHVEVRDTTTGAILRSVFIASDGSTFPEVPAASKMPLKVLDIGDGKSVGVRMPLPVPMVELKLSRDQTRVLSLDYEGIVTVWDAKTGSKTFELDTKNPQWAWVMFLGDSTDIAVAAIGQDIRTFNTETGDCLTEIAHESPTMVTSFPKDPTRLLSVSNGTEVTVWDPRTGDERLRTVSPDELAYASKLAVFSETEEVAAFISAYGRICFWAIEKNEWVQPIDIAFANLCFSPNSRRLATATYESQLHEAEIWVWDVASYTIIAKLPVYSIFAPSMAFTPDGAYIASFISGAYERLIKVFHIDGLLLDEGSTKTDKSSAAVSVVSKAYKRLNKYLGSSRHQQEQDTSDEVDRSPDKYCATYVAFSKDNKWLAVAVDKTRVDLWTGAGVFVRTILDVGGKELVDQVSSLNFSWDSKVLAVGRLRGGLSLCSLLPGIEDEHLRFRGEVRTVVFSGDQTRICAANHLSMEVYDRPKGASQYSTPREIYPVSRFAIPSGEKCAVSVALLDDLVVYVSAGHGILLMDGTSGDEIKRFPEAHYRSTIAVDVRCVEGKLQIVSGSSDGILRLTDVDTGAVLGQFSAPGIHSLYFSPEDADTLVSNLGFINLAQYYDAQDGHPRVFSSGYGLSSTGDWITRDGERLVWLPKEYRGIAQHSAVGRSQVAIGSKRGRLIVVNLRAD